MKAILALFLLVSGLPAAPAGASIPPAATKFLNLFRQLRAAEAMPAAARPRVAFAVSATEINEYMKYSLGVTPRPGLDSVTVKVFPANYISTFTVLDFDAVERWKPGTIPLLLKPFLHGKKTIWVDFRFQTASFRATLSVEKAYYNDIRLPAFFVQKAIEIVAARQPEHYDTSKPVPLPFGLRQLWTENQVVKGGN